MREPDLDYEIKDQHFSAIGKRGIRRLDGHEKASGAAIYTNDIKLPGMLYARVLTSPHPHARIRGLDTKKAEDYPGVRAGSLTTSLITPTGSTRTRSSGSRPLSASTKCRSGNLEDCHKDPGTVPCHHRPSLRSCNDQGRCGHKRKTQGETARGFQRVLSNDEEGWRAEGALEFGSSSYRLPPSLLTAN